MPATSLGNRLCGMAQNGHLILVRALPVEGGAGEGVDGVTVVVTMIGSLRTGSIHSERLWLMRARQIDLELSIKLISGT